MPLSSHDRRVEAFYAPGAVRRGDYHDGFLNFGLWGNGASDYGSAARALVSLAALRLSLPRRAKLVDAGCGTAAECVHLIECHGVARIEAYDVTGGHVLLAVDRIEKAGFTRQVALHHDSAVATGLASSAYDGVIAVESAVHFETLERFVAEAFRVLKPGARVALADICLGARRPPAWAFPLVRFAAWSWVVPWANAVTVEAYADSFARAGFSDVRIEDVGQRTVPGYLAEQERKEIRARQAILQGSFRAQAPVGTPLIAPT